MSRKKTLSAFQRTLLDKDSAPQTRTLKEFDAIYEAREAKELEREEVGTAQPDYADAASARLVEEFDYTRKICYSMEKMGGIYAYQKGQKIDQSLKDECKPQLFLEAEQRISQLNKGIRELEFRTKY